MPAACTMQSAGQLLTKNTHQELYHSMLEITHKLDKVKKLYKNDTEKLQATNKSANDKREISNQPITREISNQPITRQVS